MIGETIDSYRIEALLGEGGMGSVYRAVDINLGRPAALKLMHPHLARQPEFRQRFIQEARSAANLSHPSIVRIYQFEARGELMFIAMEYFPGGTLTAHINRAAGLGQSIDLRETLAIIAQIADALDYAHRRGIVHRDIKPDNILLANLDQPERPGEPPLRAVVTDFGLARLRTAGAVQTQDGAFMGTLAYMSPEQCLGKDIDGRSDIYALGIMLYQMATNRLPFDVRTPSDAMMKHINEPPPPPRNFSPNLPEIVSSIILKCLAKNADQRFAAAADLAAALRSTAASLTDAQVTDYAPPATVIHLNTQLAPGQPAQRGVSVFGGPVAPVSTHLDRLQITNSSGATGRLIPINDDSIVIGRDKDCAVVLDDNRASRKHARIDKSGEKYTITDLNSTNGTYLAGARLLPDVPEPWLPEKILQIGENYLRIVPAKGPNLRSAAQSAGNPAGTPAGAPAGASAYVAAAGTGSAIARVSITLTQSDISVEPGQPASVSINLLNQGPVVDHFRLTVEGIPPAWLPTLPPLVQLLPGGQQTISFTIQPPRTAQARAGSYPLTLRAVSQDNPNQTASARLTVSVRPFSQFTTELFPQRVQAGRAARLTVTNSGNAAQTFQVSWADRGDEVTFEPQQVQLPVTEGQSALVEFRARPKQRALVGGEKTYPFTTRIIAPDGVQQSQAGELVGRALVPTWVLPILISLCLCLALAGGGALANSAGLLAFTRSATPSLAPPIADLPTNTPPQAAAATPTAGVVAVSPTDTPVPATDTPPAAPVVVARLVQPNPNAFQPAVDDLVFQVLAYDSRVGANDGDGIKAVEFDFYDQNGALVYQNTETNPGYCSFQGGEPDCILLNFIKSRKMWPNGAPIFNGNYRMNAIAYAEDGSKGEVEFPFSIKMPPARLVYSSDRNGNNQIFVRDLETDQETNLSNTSSASDYAPAWSPDGKAIAFQSYRDGNAEIYLMDADGGSLRNLSQSSASNETEPAWTPDGRWIAYTSDRNGNQDIFITNVSDGSTFQVTFDSDDDDKAAFSPDGKTMAFVSNRGSGLPDLYAMQFDLDTIKSGLEGRYSEIYASHQSESDPAWSPDGKYLAFSSGNVGSSNIYYIEMGGAPLAVTDSLFYDNAPVWLPDGKHILYVETESYSTLMIANLDGSNARVYLDSPGYNNTGADFLP